MPEHHEHMVHDGGTMTYEVEGELLDPQFPGEWLAGVGLSSFGTGRWRRRDESRFSAWYYEHDGDLPEVWRLQEALRDLGPVPDDPIWLLFSGQGRHNRAEAGRNLAAALEDVDIEDLRLRRPHRPHGSTASSWMIDESWRRHPGAGLSSDDPTPVPLIEASLALIGAHSELLDKVSTWLGRSVAVGWLWDTDVQTTHDSEGEIVWPEPPLDAFVMAWRRVPRKGEPHAGALGMGKALRLSPPTWKRWIPSELHGPPTLGEAAASYMARLPEVGDTVGIKEVSELLSITPKEMTALTKKAQFPPARWVINGKPAWSWSADIQPWAELFGPIPSTES